MSIFQKIKQYLTSKPIVEKPLELPPHVKSVLSIAAPTAPLQQPSVSAKASAMHSLQLMLLFSTEEPQERDKGGTE